MGEFCSSLVVLSALEGGACDATWGQSPSERQLEAGGMGWCLEIWTASIDMNWCHIILVTIREIRPWSRVQHALLCEDNIGLDCVTGHSLQGYGV